MRKKYPDMAPEPGQSHTKSHEITLQVHFTASTVLRKILTLPWEKNPDTVAGRILREKILARLSVLDAVALWRCALWRCAL